MSVFVAGQAISQERIFREAQYHPASCWDAACHEATRALVIRELLLSEAAECGFDTKRAETSEREVQSILSAVVERAVGVPEVSDQDCLEFFEQNRERFVGDDLFEASHILLACSKDPQERGLTRARAMDLVIALKEAPERFERVARETSACPSASSGGRLGQLSPGETVPEFEQVLRGMRPGDIHSEPVATNHGYHVVRLDERSAGRALPYASVEAKIRIYLRERDFRERLQTYIRDVARRRGVVGFDITAPAPEPAPGSLPAAGSVDATDVTPMAAPRVAEGGGAGRRHLPVFSA